MPVRPEESLAKMIASLKEKTGRTLEEWKELIEKAGLQKHGEVMSYLKGEHGISHGYANQIALHRNDSPSAGAAAEDPIAAVFAGRELAKGLYNALITKIQAFGADVDIAPKKAYVSVRRKKQFAILQPAANRLDVGINLPGVPPSGRLEASGSFNAMVSHRVKVAVAGDIDPELLAWLRQAYDAA